MIALLILFGAAFLTWWRLKQRMDAIEHDMDWLATMVMDQ